MKDLFGWSSAVMEVAIAPDGGTVFITQASSDEVSVIDTATNTVTATVSVGTRPMSIAITARPREDGGPPTVTDTFAASDPRATVRPTERESGPVESIRIQIPVSAEDLAILPDLTKKCTRMPAS
jgi:YVTN family beta-propeller protein